MKENHLQVTKTARYFTAGPDDPDRIAFHWICCHGYAHTAKSVMDSLLPFQKPDQYFIAPEGLSRFYRKGFTGEVVASWMTSDDRIAEIDDYTRYLQAMYDRELPHIPLSSKGVGFGFSQGTATIIRWATVNRPNIDTFILYAGLLPEDIHYDPNYWAGKNIFFAYGDEDPFLTDARLAWQREFAKSNKLNLVEIPFQGQHEILKAALEMLDKRIRAK